MVLLTVLVIYNVALTVALLPDHSGNYKHGKFAPKLNDAMKLPEVFMHVFVEPDEEINVNKFLPSIREITDEHLEFEYTLIFLVNDTTVENTPFNGDELNNNMVLDDIFNTKQFTYKHITKIHNINVMQISLRDYLDSSSLKKRWRNIQPDFIPFFVRAISIWDRKGVAFNPVIINADNLAYIEKLHSILQSFGKSDKHISRDTTQKSKSIAKKNLNNIRDIIEAIENGNDLNDHHIQDNLTEAETDDIEVAKAYHRNLLSIVERNSDSSADSKSHLENNTINDILHKLNMLPLFLDLIRNKKHPKLDNKKNEDILIRQRKSPNSMLNKTALYSTGTKKVETRQPMIIATKLTGNKHADKVIELEEGYFPDNWDKHDRLTIDIKGNIIAAEVSCHAFIATLFDEIFDKPAEENITDFLIRELSQFCKGVLSRCRGVDVILL